VEKLVENLSPKVTLIISSDHGNLEDLSTKSHTLNPVPLMAIGLHSKSFQQVADLTQVTPSIIKILREESQLKSA
jgi:bisphosphoglycerate-independent phosphoglycerate mutase (AlkP superfamily)